jgi:hypothetical protein
MGFYSTFVINNVNVTALTEEEPPVTQEPPVTNVPETDDGMMSMLGCTGRVWIDWRIDLYEAP